MRHFTLPSEFHRGGTRSCWAAARRYSPCSFVTAGRGPQCHGCDQRTESAGRRAGQVSLRSDQRADRPGRELGHGSDRLHHRRDQQAGELVTGATSSITGVTGGLTQQAAGLADQASSTIGPAFDVLNQQLQLCPVVQLLSRSAQRSSWMPRLLKWSRCTTR